MNEDAIDRLVVQWEKECPNLDVSAMQVIGRILRLGNKFEAEANRELKKYNLKYTDFDIIATLRRSGKPYKLTPSQLCESVILTSGAMTTALDRLEKAGLVQRQQELTDKRVRSAALTPMGVNLAEKAAVERSRLAGEELTSLSLDERNQLGQLLKKLISAN